MAGCERVFGAGVFDELVFAAAGCELVGAQFGRIKATKGEVSAEEDIEAVVDGVEAVVADEDQGVEALEDHADLFDAVPTVMATW